MRTAIVATATVLAFVQWSLAHAQAASTDSGTESAGTLEEVTVTAQRREESLQRAAVPVTAISGEALGSSSRVQDLTQLVPSLQIGSAAGPYPLMYVRSIVP